MLTAYLSGAYEVPVVQIAPDTFQSVWTLAPGLYQTRGVIYQDGAELANWYANNLPQNIAFASTGELRITWSQWDLRLEEAFRKVLMVLAA